ncbi:MAG: ComEC/Rec2 family competence protein [Acidimicrobiia bacterium]|nr:ComEC/Rec2 family competence protein [Acidimicrobiia bacterium]
MVWVSVGAARSFGMAAILLVVPAVAARRTWVIGLVVAGLIAGLGSTAREAATLDAPVPVGAITVAGRLVDDPRPYGSELRMRLEPSHLLRGEFWVPWSGPRLAVLTGDAGSVAAGERIRVAGRLRPVAGRVRGDPVAGTLRADSVSRLEPASDPVFSVGNMVRRRVLRVLEPEGRAGALLAGFLVGHTEALPERDQENLRRAGLTHFVAVSGSNVALFLGAWFVAAGPLGWNPRRRLVVGLLGIVLFVVITRWEPSVVRASLMAALVLAGRVLGLALSTWAALGSAVVLSLLVAGHLAGDVGFQLSVAATAGVLAGSRLARAQPPLVAALSITLGAQGAVAPLLLWHFGSVPLLSPLTNVLAAPIVTLATGTAGLAVVTGHGAVLDVATALADIVLGISSLAAAWPQLGAGGVAAVFGALAALRLPSLRPLVAVGAALVFVVLVLPPARVAVPTVVFLDIGQGDATLLLGPAGETVLVDGGPDPGVLLDRLRDYGVTRFDLVVATHGDLDHIGGLLTALDSFPADRLWHPGHRAGSDRYEELLAGAQLAGVKVETVEQGWAARVGSFEIGVLGPARRYADLNDESVVLQVDVNDRSVLLAGDIEVTAQRALGVVETDILKVPHHGANTSDLAWLEQSAAPLAIISVGPNDFGHPHPAVVDALVRGGSVVRRTDQEGDIVVPLGP